MSPPGHQSDLPPFASEAESEVILEQVPQGIPMGLVFLARGA